MKYFALTFITRIIKIVRGVIVAASNDQPTLELQVFDGDTMCQTVGTSGEIAPVGLGFGGRPLSPWNAPRGPFQPYPTSLSMFPPPPPRF